MLYFGRVTRIDDDKVYCTVPDLGGRDYEFGPLPIVEWVLGSNWSGSTSGVSLPSHGYHNHSATVYSSSMVLTKNDLVVVAQMGLVKEDLVVLGTVVLIEAPGNST